ncbi:ribosome biogenesis GTPase Der [Desulfurispora thermophila]|uniref:ribosome biogenesis GTPase Der n=1 Tax=Desulfurispora thermophila TaxID=265470 RepID=UPI000360BE37|nr:ribosome biogenesis GTPase Der [Desulfurispora thermophila]
MSKPVVAVVGRPNVGKSTLFNRLVGARIAIVEDIPGVTRDRLYKDADWNGRSFTLVDTGGLDYEEEGEIISNVRRQAELAIAEADLVLFVVDARAGLTPADEAVASVLRRSEKPVILVANKVENYQNKDYYEFYQLGLGDPFPVSALEGLNTGDLLDEVLKHLPAREDLGEEPDVIKIAMLGRPNVGKSSLVNAILGEQRVVVSEIPGTTRDAIDTAFTREGQNYLLIDTAGIRRRARIVEATEKYSVIRALKAIDRCDIVLAVIDATSGVTEQDKRLIGYSHEKGRGLVLLVNKWDLVVKDDKTMDKYTRQIRTELGFVDYAPILFVSALTRQRVPKILSLVNQVASYQSMRLSTADLNSVLREAFLHSPPPSYKGRKLKLLYATQVAVKPPRFVLFVNDDKLVHFSYLRYLENQLRQAYLFTGTPLQIRFRSRGER